jgi:hypothetical protein
MIRGKKPTPAFLLLLVFFLAFFSSYDLAQQDKPEEQIQVTQAQKEKEKIVPSPKNIKESTGIYVFVGWIWLAVFILVFFLRLKIKEVDRLYRLGYFSQKKK